MNTMSAPRWYLPTVSEIIALSEQASESASEQGDLEWIDLEESGLPPERSGAAKFDPGDRPRLIARKRARAERDWYGAVAALNDLLRSLLNPSSSPVAQPVAIEGHGSASPASSPGRLPIRGLMLSGSAPILERGDMLSQISAWTFTPDASRTPTYLPCPLLPAGPESQRPTSTPTTIPLAVDDPLATEQFCVVMTPQFQLAMSLGTDADGMPVFLFSFAPEVVWKAWRSLQSRLRLKNLPMLHPLTTLVKQFPPLEPHYRIVTQFHRLMLSHLPDVPEGRSRRRPRRQRLSPPTLLHPESVKEKAIHPNFNISTKTKLHPLEWDGVMNGAPPEKSQTSQPSGTPISSDSPTSPPEASKSGLDVELLQAIAHEVRTPLTTIRTLTRLLLRRTDLPPEVIKRLTLIDRECTEQIDRFNLIFRAVELETNSQKEPQTPLAAISLDQMFDQNIPRWQAQAHQHSLTLDVSLPQKLPLVVSDPTMLEQVLTGLIDRITHTLPAGSHIQVEATLAGHQLKLQFQAQPQDADTPTDFLSELSSYFAPTLKSIGDLLMFQPETGNLSLNLAVTKNLFQALGGKLTIRHRPHQGEILTIFLPLQD
jgi:hypothetical protein